MILVIDNYDSFTWTLVQYLRALGSDVRVARNDALTPAEALAAGPAAILISPGPGTPDDAGISLGLVAACAAARLPLLGVCRGMQVMTVASGVIVHAFVVGNYSIKYVQRYSESAQPLGYKLASYWGGLDGSVMFWVFLLSLFGAAAVRINKERHRELIPYVVATLSVVQMFFLFLMIAHNNPFATYLTDTPRAGAGLNPLLQNFYMAIHPPTMSAPATSRKAFLSCATWAIATATSLRACWIGCGSSSTRIGT